MNKSYRNFSPRVLASSTVKMVDCPNIWQQCRLKLDGYGCWSVLPSPQTAKNDFNFSSNISHVKTCRVRVPQPTSQILPHWLPFPPNIWQGGMSMSYTEAGQRETAHCTVVSSGKAWLDTGRNQLPDIVLIFGNSWQSRVYAFSLWLSIKWLDNGGFWGTIALIFWGREETEKL